MPTKGRKKFSNDTIPWEQMKSTFVSHATLSLKKLAAQFSVDVTHVYNRSKADGWQTARREYQRQVALEILEIAREEIVKTAGQQTVSMLRDLERLRKAAIDRYLRQLDNPESSEELEISEPTEEGERSKDVVLERRRRLRKAALNHSRFVDRVIRIEADLLLTLTGVKHGARLSGVSRPGTPALELEPPVVVVVQ